MDSGTAGQAPLARAKTKLGKGDFVGCIHYGSLCLCGELHQVIREFIHILGPPTETKLTNNSDHG